VPDRRGAEAPRPEPPPPAASPALVAHEWGTFTSVQGTDGVSLEGLHHEDEPLPPFVHGRCTAMPSCLHPGQKSIEAIPEGVTQKLETPVIYFYTEQAQQVAVEVDFPEGVISQWFPAAAAFQPPLGEMTAIAGGSMQWLVAVDPALDPEAAPWVPEHDIWAPSRRTQAAPLAVGGETEGFIFYRGVGRFELPVRVTTAATGALRVANEGDLALPGAFLMRTDGELGGIVALGALAAGQHLEVARAGDGPRAGGPRGAVQGAADRRAGGPRGSTATRRRPWSTRGSGAGLRRPGCGCSMWSRGRGRTRSCRFASTRSPTRWCGRSSGASRC
jgi:hypothetical protein